MFVGETGSGHAIVIDGPPDHGGRNMGARPMELMLLGVGSCSSFDVVQILQKGRNDVVIALRKLPPNGWMQSPAFSARYTCTLRSAARDLKAAAVERAVKLSAEKYCSASIMLSKAAEITHDFEVIEV